MHDRWMLTSKDMEGRIFNRREISPHFPISLKKARRILLTANVPIKIRRQNLWNAGQGYISRSPLFWVIMQRVVVIHYRSFGTTYRFLYFQSLLGVPAASTCSVSYCYHTVHRPTRVQKECLSLRSLGALFIYACILNATLIIF
jgi:hypothetical protein